ncbi:hypothetical protein [Microterricola gilva]|uniref:hypothetical protein n=1 Tax=Microterricola gilva TaxID=393267 RepID=UPI00102C5B79|nr:hypothetical protein [Microterricola gilva]
MNTTQKTQRVLAAALIAVSVGALTACSPQIAETGDRPAAEARAPAGVAPYRDFAERLTPSDLAPAHKAEVPYRDFAERLTPADLAPAQGAEEPYPDYAERLTPADLVPQSSCRD